MFAVRTSVFRRALVGSAVFVLIAASGLARAQTPGTGFGAGLPAGPIVSPSSSAGPSGTPYGSTPSSSQPQLDNSGTGKESTLGRTPLAGAEAAPSFQWGASATFSESYVSNANGIAGLSQPDYLSMLGFSANVHEHTRTLSIDANYNFMADFYANGTVPTQISNFLQAVGTAQVIPDYLNFSLKAFAQPVVTTGLGVLTAGNREVPGNYSNSYGYTASPDLRFRFGEFATSETTPNFSQIYFTAPNGTTAANTIPSLFAPQDTTMRSVTETIAAGPDFGRLNWTLVGLFSETDNNNVLLSEKTGTGNVRYAIDYDWSLLFTGGYDSINDSTPLIAKVSAPFALAGFGLNLGQDFAFQIEAGVRYKKFSVTSNLRYGITPTSELTASVNDYIQTPEGQLLNNLGSLNALANGTITSSQNTFANGTGSLLGSSGIQSSGNPALDQQLSRYQTANIAWVEQLDRNSIAVSLFGTRRGYLTSGFVGPQTSISWGGILTFSHSFTPLLSGSLGTGYTNDEEFGGTGKTINAYGGLNYALSRTTNAYLQSSYLTRASSPSLQALSPLTGDVSDFTVTVGISHAF